MKHIIKNYIYALFLLPFLYATSLEACTGIKLVAKDGSTVHGRTVEFGRNIDASLASVPRGYSFTGTTPNGPGLSYVSKYGFIGVMTFDQPSILDGINEKGLSVGTFFFPGFAGYSHVSEATQNHALSPSEFPNWILSQFATIDEVRAALPAVIITPTIEKGWGDTPPPFHYIVYDRDGKSIVIEPMYGSTVIYDNTMGVITNSPTFDWHMLHLRNYINLTATNILPQRLDGVILAPFGQGSGMVGLPGDYTPPSRFVRAAFFSQYALPSENSEKAVFQLFHILNAFDIPTGIAREIVNGTLYADTTLLTCVRDPKTLRYYYKSYEEQNIRFVDLKKMDLNATAIKKLPISHIQSSIDMSQELK